MKCRHPQNVINMIYAVSVFLQGALYFNYIVN